LAPTEGRRDGIKEAREKPRKEEAGAEGKADPGEEEYFRALGAFVGSEKETASLFEGQARRLAAGMAFASPQWKR
jgi:hypothetical protein